MQLIAELVGQQFPRGHVMEGVTLTCIQKVGEGIFCLKLGDGIFLSSYSGAGGAGREREWDEG